MDVTQNSNSTSCDSPIRKSKKLKERFKDLENQLATSKDDLKQLSSEFSTYKKQKEYETKILNEDVKKLKKENENSSAKCCKLATDLDLANEKIHSLQANVNFHKSQNEAMEIKCTENKRIISKFLKLYILKKIL